MAPRCIGLRLRGPSRVSPPSGSLIGLLLAKITSPLVVALLLGRWKILAAVHADVAEMPRSALPAVHWEAQEDARLPALLSRGASVSEAHGEPLEVFLKSALTSPSVSSCVFMPY